MYVKYRYALTKYKKQTDHTNDKEKINPQSLLVKTTNFFFLSNEMAYNA